MGKAKGYCDYFMVILFFFVFNMVNASHKAIISAMDYQTHTCGKIQDSEKKVDQFTRCLIPSKSRIVNVMDLGAREDGAADDTDAIIAAVSEAVDGLVEFPCGCYLITKTIDVVLTANGSLCLSGQCISRILIMLGFGMWLTRKWQIQFQIKFKTV